MPFLVGEPVVLTNTFTVSNVATDPTTVALAVTTPAGVTTTYTYAAAQITKTGTGVYTKTITASEVGTWVYVWTGTGAVSDIAPGYFAVAEVGPTYVTIADIRENANLADVTKFPNARVAAAIDWFETTFEDYTGVAWLPRTVTDERHYVTSSGLLILDHLYPRTVSAVRAHSTASASTAYTADELADLRIDPSGVLRRISLGSFTSGYGIVGIDYTHSVTDSPPVDVVRACKIAVQGELLKDRNGRLPYSVVVEGQLQWFSKPGPDRPFGNEDVDEVANRRRQKTPAVA